MSDDSPIRPRTDSEQRAYRSGWTQALIMVGERGMRAAQAELILMADVSGDFTEKEVAEMWDRFRSRT